MSLKHNSKRHNCKECQDKLIPIIIDKVKGTCCRYCSKAVKYSMKNNGEIL